MIKFFLYTLIALITAIVIDKYNLTNDPYDDDSRILEGVFYGFFWPVFWIAYFVAWIWETWRDE